MRKAVIAVLLSFVGLAAILWTVGWFMIRSVDLPGEAVLANGTARNVAQYVEMEDGVKLAVDVWFPADAEAGQPLPTVMRSTRYWRSQDIGPLMRLQIAMTGTDPALAVPAIIQEFNEAGYAVVLVDVRGSGASFGDRPMEYGRTEARDLGEVADWVAAQPWSNGRVGTWGVSYEGTTAAMAAWTASPAVTAIAPQYADFDAWSQLLWPGGVFAKGFIDEWNKMIQFMDAGDICALAGIDGFLCSVMKYATRGVKRVDGPDGDRLYADALAQHDTPDVSVAAGQAEFRDASFGGLGETVASVSIGGYRDGIERSGAAIFSWSGWLDAGTADGALTMFSTFSNPVRTIIGPWSHGGGHHVDPFLPDSTRTEPTIAEQRRMLIEFFDHYVKNQPDAPGEGVGEIRYFTFNDGWHTTTQWPPAGVRPVRWYFGDEGTLVRTRPAAGDASDAYTVDDQHSTGSTTRWHTQLGGADVAYPGRAAHDTKLLTYTSEPLESDTEISGAVEVDLHVASTHEDGAFFAYLEVVDPNGYVRYITEGQLRAIHRRPCADVRDAPCHTFGETDAMPLVPGEAARIRFALFQTSVRVPAGHRIRIALAGHDGSMFERYPAEGDPAWTVYRNRARPSGVVIPMRVVEARS